MSAGDQSPLRYRLLVCVFFALVSACFFGGATASLAYNAYAHRQIAKDAFEYMYRSPRATANQKAAVNELIRLNGSLEVVKVILGNAAAQTDYEFDMCFNTPIGELYDYAGHNFTAQNHYVNVRFPGKSWDRHDGYFYEYSSKLGNDELAMTHWLVDNWAWSVTVNERRSTCLQYYRKPTFTGSYSDWSGTWNQPIGRVRFVPITSLADSWYRRYVPQAGKPAIIDDSEWHYNFYPIDDLGPVVHAASDVTVPHHVIGSHDLGHQEYENYVDACLKKGTFGRDDNLVFTHLQRPFLTKGLQLGHYPIISVYSDVAQHTFSYFANANAPYSVLDLYFWMGLFFGHIDEDWGYQEARAQIDAWNDAQMARRHEQMKYLYNLAIATTVRTIEMAYEEYHSKAGTYINPYCKEYADTALRDVKRYTERYGSVPSSDPMWSPDWGVHYRWCDQQLSPGICEHETKLRKAWLNDRDAYCEQYSDTALDDINARIQRHGSVPSGDPTWSPDWIAHYRWCIQQSSPTLCDRGTKGRKAWLSQNVPSQIRVRAPASTDDRFCREYADKTMGKIEERRLHQGSLPINNTRWRADQDFHYLWCMKSDKPRCNQETAARQGWLDVNRTSPSKNLVAHESVSKDQQCKVYAEAATRQIKRRQLLTGTIPHNDMRWKPDWQVHYNWCNAQPSPSACVMEVGYREEWLMEHTETLQSTVRPLTDPKTYFSSDFLSQLKVEQRREIVDSISGIGMALRDFGNKKIDLAHLDHSLKQQQETLRSRMLQLNLIRTPVLKPGNPPVSVAPRPLNVTAQLREWVPSDNYQPAGHYRRPTAQEMESANSYLRYHFEKAKYDFEYQSIFFTLRGSYLGAAMSKVTDPRVRQELTSEINRLDKVWRTHFQKPPLVQTEPQLKGIPSRKPLVQPRDLGRKPILKVIPSQKLPQQPQDPGR